MDPWEAFGQKYNHDTYKMIREGNEEESKWAFNKMHEKVIDGAGQAIIIESYCHGVGEQGLQQIRQETKINPL